MFDNGHAIYQLVTYDCQSLRETNKSKEVFGLIQEMVSN